MSNSLRDKLRISQSNERLFYEEDVKTAVDLVKKEINNNITHERTEFGDGYDSALLDCLKIIERLIEYGKEDD